MLVIPLWEKGVVTGTLKIYYCHAHQITSTLQEMHRPVADYLHPA
jgi:two-component system LytT family sensor kinase